jgi:hypothetical protein
MMRGTEFLRPLMIAAWILAVAKAGEYSVMAQALTQDEQRLRGYLNTSIKYHVVPVPAPLDRNAAVAMVRREVTPQQTVDKMRKLMRLAVFYDLQETADVFGALLNRQEKDAQSVVRSALAIRALAWIGTNQQRLFAENYFNHLLGIARVGPHRSELLAAADELGSGQAIANLKSWVSQAIRREQARLTEAKAKKNQAAKEGTEDRIDELEDFIASDVAAVEEGIGTRRKVIGSPGFQGQVSYPVSLYLEEAEEATPSLAYWAAMYLIRVAQQAAQMPPAIAQEFYHRAASQERAGDPQEGVVVRGRALRAAEFFGLKLDDANRAWLSRQPDEGTDPLALRPNWNYPGGAHK